MDKLLEIQLKLFSILQLSGRKVSRESPNRGKIFKSLASTLGIGWVVVAAILCGLLLGHFLDRRLGSSPVFLIVFLLAGIGAGFYSAYKQIMKLL